MGTRPLTGTLVTKPSYKLLYTNSTSSRLVAAAATAVDVAEIVHALKLDGRALPAYLADEESGAKTLNRHHLHRL